jgi:hypothetical protein
VAGQVVHHAREGADMFGRGREERAALTLK